MRNTKRDLTRQEIRNSGLDELHHVGPAVKAGNHGAFRLTRLLCSAVLLPFVQGLAQVPSIANGGVVNGASFAAGSSVAPGSIISILGDNLAIASISAKDVPLPTSLATTSVRVNGMLAPLYYVSSKQINAQLPY